jgi:glutamate--cysteine ligase
MAGAHAPVLDFERRLLDAMGDIEHWFRQKWHDYTPPFYSSVDLRNAGFKLAPVDTNLFPGGFNNLAESAMPSAVQAAQVAIEHFCPNARKLVLIPERHTRNTYYLMNVARLEKILSATGLEVRIGSLSEDITEAVSIPLPDGHMLRMEPLTRTGNRVGTAGFDPCAVLLNNDMSAGLPDILRHLDPAQTMLPPAHAGWTVRRKSIHFACYDRVADEFASLVGVDPWLINPFFDHSDHVDFGTGASNTDLLDRVQSVLDRIRVKYQEHHIQQKPFVIVKADAGTYGMGIMTIRDASELAQLNRKQRNKMAVIKEGLEVSQVLIQEGVPTFEQYGNGTAEPVVYMIDRYVAGGFYRVHPGRGIDENLNAPGMHFVPLAFDCSCNLPEPAASPDCAHNRFYAYGVVGRLASLAAALELEQTDPDPLP